MRDAEHFEHFDFWISVCTKGISRPFEFLSWIVSIKTNDIFKSCSTAFFGEMVIFSKK